MQTSLGRDSRSFRFGPITVETDSGILEPRPWTLAQSSWAAELSPGLREGPILELCCGAGHIGLAAAVLTGRDLVQVDDDPAACLWATQNAAQAGGIEVSVLTSDLESTPAALGRRYPLVLADPPYVASAEVADFPEDPPHAIDGGPDGLAGVRTCLRTVARTLAPGGAALVQVRGPAQALAVERICDTLPLKMIAYRVFGPDRAVVRLSFAGAGDVPHTPATIRAGGWGE